MGPPISRDRALVRSKISGFVPQIQRVNIKRWLDPSGVELGCSNLLAVPDGGMGLFQLEGALLQDDLTMGRHVSVSSTPGRMTWCGLCWRNIVLCAWRICEATFWNRAHAPFQENHGGWIGMPDFRVGCSPLGVIKMDDFFGNPMKARNPGCCRAQSQPSATEQAVAV